MSTGVCRALSAGSQRAFTLIELVTVIVLLGIVTAVAGPRFFNNDVFSQRGYIDELAASIRHAQRIAIASQCEVRFTSTAAGYNAVQRAAFGTTCNPAGTWTVPVIRSDGTPLAGTAPSGAVAVPDIVIDFDLEGVPNAVPLALTLGTFILTVAPQTGIVTVLP